MTHPLDSTVPLHRTFVALHPRHLRYDRIATVGAALRYLRSARLCGIHWASAYTGLRWAHLSEAGIDAATRGFDNALRTDELLVKTVPPAR
jgi:hypothetical protein